MITISKNHLSNMLLLSYLSEKKHYEDKICLFENKYNTNFEKFEKLIKNSETENFSFWDDYIEWKAYVNFFKQINNQIIDVKRGDFQLA